MGKKGSSAPAPDPRMGEAAMLSSQTGRDYLAWMKERSKISDYWAQEDRARAKGVFEPIQDGYINDVYHGPDYDGVDAAVDRAGADARRQFSMAQGQEERRLAAQGVDPRSGRSREATRRSELTEALATTGARNTTRINERDKADAEYEMKRSNVLNMGSGMAVNPATSLGMATSAGSSGFRGAMQGYGQQANILSAEHSQRMSAWQADQAQSNSLFGGIGSLVGLGISTMSSKDYKENKTKPRGVLDALKEMPVEEWDYKEGIADGGRHIGPYAEDFHAATGKGDGKSIPLQDAIGLTMGAVQELSDKVDKLDAKPKRKARSVMSDAPPEKVKSGPSPRSITEAA